MDIQKSKCNETYLISEYNQMFEEKRHYDNRLFAFITLFLTLLAAAVAIIEFTQNDKIAFWILLAQDLTGMAVIFAQYHNHVSNVKVCRQINTIRKMMVVDTDFEPLNKMYIDDNKPPYFKPDTMHSILSLFVTFITSVCVGFTITTSGFSVGVAKIWGAIIFCLIVSLNIILLVLRDLRDEAKKKKTK